METKTRPRAQYGQRYVDEVEGTNAYRVIPLDLPVDFVDPSKSAYGNNRVAPHERVILTPAASVAINPGEVPIDKITMDDPETARLLDPVRKRLIENENMDPETATEIISGNMSPREIQRAISLHRLRQPRRGKTSSIEKATKQETAPIFSSAPRQREREMIDFQRVLARRTNRREFLLATGGVILAAAGGGTLVGVANSFSQESQSSDSVSPLAMTSDHITHVPADALTLSTPRGEINHQKWSQEMSLKEPLKDSAEFPKDKLAWNFTLEDGEQIGSIVIEDQEVVVDGLVAKDRTEKGDESLQVSAFLDEVDETLVVDFTQTEEHGFMDEETVTVPLHAYTYTPEDPLDHPRVFSEIDVDTLYPDKQILKTAHELVLDFAGILPDVTVSLYDASDTKYFSSDPTDYFNVDKQQIKLPIQYWTDPAYPKQDTLTLFRMLSFATLSTSKSDLSGLAVETGKLEQVIQNAQEETRQIQLDFIDKIKKASGNEIAMQINMSDSPHEATFVGFDRGHYDPNLVSEPVFTANYYVPNYPKLFVDGLTIMANFASEFTSQFFYDDSNNPLYLTPLQQKRTIDAAQQLFAVLDKLSYDEENWRKIIPEYDRLRDFVFTHRVPAT